MPSYQPITASQVKAGDRIRLGKGRDWIPATVAYAEILTQDIPHPGCLKYPADHPLHNYKLDAGRVMIKFEGGGWVCPAQELVIYRVGPATEDSKSLRELLMTGVTQRGDVHVKIVPHPTGYGFGVETTVKGDRRYPTEGPLALEMAQGLALKQLTHPRPTQMPR